MTRYLSPGVYVEEVPPLARPIAGVGTSTPAFVGVIPDTVQLPARIPGQTESKFVDFSLAAPGRAAAGKPYNVTSWTQYTQLFGDFVGDEQAAATAVANAAVNS